MIRHDNEVKTPSRVNTSDNSDIRPRVTQGSSNAKVNLKVTRTENNVGGQIKQIVRPRAKGLRMDPPSLAEKVHM